MSTSCSFLLKNKGYIIFIGLFLYFLSLIGFIAYYGLHDQVKPVDFIVILGNEVYADGTPSPRLRSRLDAGLASYQQGLGKWIVVSGGTDKHSNNEAAVMSDYLENKGVPVSAIIIDPSGYNTLDSVKNVRESTGELVKANPSVLVISQYFHLSRSVNAFRSCGFKTVYHKHADFFETRDIYSLIREFFAWQVYAFKGCR